MYSGSKWEKLGVIYGSNRYPVLSTERRLGILWQEGRHLLRQLMLHQKMIGLLLSGMISYVAANYTAAHNFIEDLDLLLINQDHRQH